MKKGMILTGFILLLSFTIVYKIGNPMLAIYNRQIIKNINEITKDNSQYINIGKWSTISNSLDDNDDETIKIREGDVFEY